MVSLDDGEGLLTALDGVAAVQFARAAGGKADGQLVALENAYGETGTLAANKEKFAAFRRNMLENNVLILPDGRWYISAVHTDKELERTLAAIDAGMAAI